MCGTSRYAAECRIADLETKLTIGEKEGSIQAPFGGFRFAAVRVDKNNLQDDNDWKTGLYLLEKNATQVGAILDGTQPEATEKFGGADGSRTHGLFVANEALSQLSYSPTYSMVDFKYACTLSFRSALFNA